MWINSNTKAVLAVAIGSVCLFKDSVTGEDVDFVNAELKVTDEAMSEAMHYIESGIPDKFSNDDELQEFVVDYIKRYNFDMDEFKQLDVHLNSQIEYDQAVLLAVLDQTIRQRQGSTNMSMNNSNSNDSQSLREMQEARGRNEINPNFNHVHQGISSGPTLSNLHRPQIHPQVGQQPMQNHRPQYQLPQQPPMQAYQQPMLQQPYPPQPFYPQGQDRYNPGIKKLPTGSVMDSVELYVQIAKNNNNVMGISLVELINSLYSTETKMRNIYRYNDVIIVRERYSGSLMIQLPSGAEFEVQYHLRVSDVLMRCSIVEAEEDDILALAEAIDLIVFDLAAAEEQSESDMEDNTNT